MTQGSQAIAGVVGRWGLAAAVGLAVGCAGASPSPAGPSTGATAALHPPRRAPPGSTVGLVSKDGLRLHAEWRTPAGRAPPHPTVLLLHDVAGDLAQWDLAWRGFEARGWAALALDLRGHGESIRREDGGEVRFERLGPLGVAVMPVDVWAALDWLRAHPDVDGRRLGVVGAGLGANLAWVASGTEWGVRAAVALSPGIRTSTTGEEISGLAPWGVLIVAGELDAGAVTAGRRLAARSAGAHRVLLVRGTAGHGTDLLEAGAAGVVMPAVGEWLERRWADMAAGLP